MERFKGSTANSVGTFLVQIDLCLCNFDVLRRHL